MGVIVYGCDLFIVGYVDYVWCVVGIVGVINVDIDVCGLLVKVEVIGNGYVVIIVVIVDWLGGNIVRVFIYCCDCIGCDCDIICWIVIIGVVVDGNVKCVIDCVVSICVSSDGEVVIIVIVVEWLG